MFLAEEKETSLCENPLFYNCMMMLSFAFLYTAVAIFFYDARAAKKKKN